MVPPVTTFSTWNPRQMPNTGLSIAMAFCISGISSASRSGARAPQQSSSSSPYSPGWMSGPPLNSTPSTRSSSSSKSATWKEPSRLLSWIGIPPQALTQLIKFGKT